MKGDKAIKGLEKLSNFLLFRFFRRKRKFMGTSINIFLTEIPIVFI